MSPTRGRRPCQTLARSVVAVTLRERHKKALWKKARRDFSGYPVATVAFYGPDEKAAMKVGVGIIRGEGEEPVALERWFSDAIDVRNHHSIIEKVLAFVQAHEAESVAMVERVIGWKLTVPSLPRSRRTRGACFGGGVHKSALGCARSPTESDTIANGARQRSQASTAGVPWRIQPTRLPSSRQKRRRERGRRTIPSPSRRGWRAGASSLWAICSV